LLRFTDFLYPPGKALLKETFEALWGGDGSRSLRSYNTLPYRRSWLADLPSDIFSDNESPWLQKLEGDMRGRVLTTFIDDTGCGLGVPILSQDQFAEYGIDLHGMFY
jgi:hypothetical protein